VGHRSTPSRRRHRLVKSAIAMTVAFRAVAPHTPSSSLRPHFFFVELAGEARAELHRHVVEGAHLLWRFGSGWFAKAPVDAVTVVASMNSTLGGHGRGNQALPAR
jgi:hypothetical protein